jgi:peptidoglycan/LPS O-acetylase OafA/YrhL
MNVLFSLYLLVLFLVLTPGVLVTLPKNGSKYTITAVHGLIFAAILYVTGHYVWKLTGGALEGLMTRVPGGAKKKRTSKAPKAPKAPK